MSIAGPRVVAEGFATIMQMLVEGDKEIPYWHAAPSLYTDPVHREQVKKQESVEDQFDIPDL